MNLKCNLFFIVLFLSLNAFGQEKLFRTATTYVEVLGTGLSWYTVNAEKVFFKVGQRFGAVHIGYGTYHKEYENHPELGGYNKWSLPIGLSLFKGEGKHHSEFGFSATYISGLTDNAAMAGSSQDLERSESLYLVVNFGYRFHKPEGGFFMRFQITPAIKLKEFANDAELKKQYQRMLAAGLSLGYTF